MERLLNVHLDARMEPVWKKHLVGTQMVERTVMVFFGSRMTYAFIFGFVLGYVVLFMSGILSFFLALLIGVIVYLLYYFIFEKMAW